MRVGRLVAERAMCHDRRVIVPIRGENGTLYVSSSRERERVRWSVQRGQIFSGDGHLHAAGNPPRKDYLVHGRLKLGRRVPLGRGDVRVGALSPHHTWGESPFRPVFSLPACDAPPDQPVVAGVIAEAIVVIASAGRLSIPATPGHARFFIGLSAPTRGVMVLSDGRLRKA